jgi:hypothetical protein
MKKKYFFLIYLAAIILLNGCGYEPVYSSKNFLFKIDKITHDKNKINNQIVRSLKSISNNKTKNLLIIELNSNKEKKIVSKDKAGNPQIFELLISINIKIEDKQKKFESKQVYNNIENKFELNEYELEIEAQIINKLIDDIIIYLSSQ